jgi:superfamily II DNA helicase RecQ
LNAKPGQVEALRHLLRDRRDLILIAKTGYGKSIIFQAAPLIDAAMGAGICLIIMPLTLLQEEQSQQLKHIPLAKPVVLIGDSNKQKLREEIGQGLYTHGSSF